MKRKKPDDGHSGHGGVPEPETASVRCGVLAAVFSERFLVWCEGREWLCTVPGRIKREFTPVVGERVEFQPRDADTGVVVSFLPRQSVLTRTMPARRGGAPRQGQVLAANVDQLVIVAALRRPTFRRGLVERLLVAAYVSGLSPLLCLSKLDLASPEEFAEISRWYAELAVPVIGVSLERPDTLLSLEAALAGKTSVLAGHSGVGKTSVLNALAEQQWAVGRVDTHRGHGRHTTTTARLIPLRQGGFAIDSPGVREFGLHGVDRRELATHYPDFQPYLDRCGFRDCQHRREPKCAVRDAVESGSLAEARYQSYLKLSDELDAG